MGICGCQASCSCTIIGIDGIAVTGDGTLDNPLVISFDPTIGGGCDRVMECVGSHLGPGLGYNATTHTIFIKVSTTAGNTTIIAADGGIYTPGCTGCNAIMTVDKMMASKGAACVLSGDIGSGSADAPAYSRPNHDLALAEWPRLQLFDLAAVRGTDGTLWWRSSTNPQDWNKAIPTTSVLPFYGQQWNLIPPNQSGTINEFAVDPLPQYPLSAYQILSQLGGKVIINLSAAPATPADRPLINAELDQMVQQLGLVKSVVRRYPFTDRAAAAAWAAFGGISMLTITTGADADATTTAGLIADGITWVFLDGTFTNVQIAKFGTAAGLTTIIRNNSQTTWNGWAGLGLDGVVSTSPLYAAGACTVPPYVYRQTISPYNNLRFWPSNWGTNVSPASRGRFAPVVFGQNPFPDTNYLMPNNLATPLTAILQGWAGPIAASFDQGGSGTYNLDWIQDKTADSGGGVVDQAGVIFGATHDQATSYVNPGALNLNGWYLRWQMDNKVALCKIINGVQQPNIPTTNAIGATGGVSATAAGSTTVTVAAGFQLRFKVAITNSTITIQLNSGNGGTPPFATPWIVPADPTLRGPYLYTAMRTGTAGWEPSWRSFIIN